MTQKVAIHWFRQDLRLQDNPALTQAAQHEHVLPIYILDDNSAKPHAMGAASRVWLHHSLTALDHSLDGDLNVYKGTPHEILAKLAKRFDIEAVYWNRCYEPWRMARDTNLKADLKARGINVQTYNASLLWEPWQVHKSDGTHYKVFTPFYRKGCLAAEPPRPPLPKPSMLRSIHDSEAMPISALGLLPQKRWDLAMMDGWTAGEQGAHQRFKDFISEGLPHYKEGRDTPAKPYVSRLSPYLHFGEISPHQLWEHVRSLGDNAQIDHFCSELGWREFSYSQLYHNPSLPTKNLQRKFDSFPWNENEAGLHAWQRGMTGIPMVDAGMRELWQTGYMHNRVRMIVGSFLVKNLRLHWHHGERWFWETLLDADLANNSASWQWIAGCGADAAPYFRVFNPVTQGQKFDTDGDYVRRFIPELAPLPNTFLFNPWEAPALVIKAAGVTLGQTYPHPIVDLRQSRQSALDAFQRQTISQNLS